MSNETGNSVLTTTADVGFLTNITRNGNIGAKNIAISGCQSLQSLGTLLAPILPFVIVICHRNHSGTLCELTMVHSFRFADGKKQICCYSLITHHELFHTKCWVDYFFKCNLLQLHITGPIK